MTRVRTELSNAIDTKRLPPFQPGHLRDLAASLRLAFPVTLSNVVHTLDNMNPAGFIYDSGPQTAGFAHASAQVYVQSDGLVSFSGQIHESGVTGDNYFFSMALLDVKDESGKTLAFATTGNVAGQLDIGRSDDSWQINNFSAAVANGWDIAKNSRVSSVFHVSTNPFEPAETAVAGIFAAAGVAIAAGLAVVFIGDSKTHCGPEAAPDAKGGAGVDFVCRREFN